MQISRRTFLAAGSALLLARPAAAEPERLAREDCFFGLHFDLHPNASDTSLGRDLTEAMAGHLLDSCQPDFIQYDSKGVAGYLGFASKTGMSAPGIVQDSLAIWRRATAARGVALYNHFTGVLDGYAIAKHPEWGRVRQDGQRDPQETSLFCPYERELMIPELLEAALNYDLDGSWVDGDCWAVKPDYSEGAQRAFHDKTGIDVLPKKPEDKGWNEFLELQREQFRRYVAEYADALHRARPGYQITSNWMYSTVAPESPDLPLDYLSGDLAEPNALRQARMEARYLASVGKPWDLMSWGFTPGTQSTRRAEKPLDELQQEAAIILAQGGAYQIYHQPTRAGWISERIVQVATDMAKFCRDRQQWSHRSETVPEVGALFSGHTVYRTGNRIFGGWDTTPVAGAIELLLACGYSVDLIPDWKTAESIAQYPLLVVPDWRDIGDEMAGIVAAYVANGGKLLLWGTENTRLFASVLHLRLKTADQYHTYFVANESDVAQVGASWIEIEAQQSEIVARAYRSSNNRRDSLPLAVRLTQGQGTVVVFPTRLGSVYAADDSPILRSVLRPVVEELHPPAVRLDGDFPALEIALRKKDGQTLLHIVNSARSTQTGEILATDMVPRTGPVGLRVRLSSEPSSVVLEPEGITLTGVFKDGEWRGSLPDVHVHAILRFAGET